MPDEENRTMPEWVPDGADKRFFTTSVMQGVKSGEDNTISHAPRPKRRELWLKHGTHPHYGFQAGENTLILRRCFSCDLLLRYRMAGDCKRAALQRLLLCMRLSVPYYREGRSFGSVSHKKISTHKCVGIFLVEATGIEPVTLCL